MANRSEGEPLVSILIPVFNSATHLPACLDSVLEQSYRNLEVICVDDASTDTSPDLLEAYAKRDPRVRVVTHSQNRGLPAARNTATSEATGVYLRHVDSDDVIPWRSTAALVRAAMEHGSQVVVGNALRLADGQLRREDWLYRFKADHFGFDLAAEPLLWRNFGGVVYYLFEAEFLKDLNLRFLEDLHYGEDQAFVSAVLPHARRICAVREVIYHYRLTSGSMSVTFTESHMQDEMRWPLLVRENLGHEYLDAYVHTLVRSTKNRMRILKYAAAYHDRDFVEGLIAQARSLWDGIPLARLYAEDLAPLSPYLKGELFPLLALLITGSDGDFFDFLTGTRRAVPAWVDGGVL